MIGAKPENSVAMEMVAGIINYVRTMAGDWTVIMTVQFSYL